MNVLVTGGLGVNGCWVTRQLLETGHHPVVLDNRPDFSLVGDIASDIEFVQADLNDFASLVSALKGRRIERICHLAAIYPGACDSNPLQGFHINALGTVQILEAARIMDVQRVVFTSSVAALAPLSSERALDPKPIDEDYPAYPGDAGVYGATKVAGELMGLNYQRLFGIEFAALRFAPIYGPGKTAPRHGDLGLSPWVRIVANALSGVPTRIDGGGDERYDLTYARDVGDSVVRACLAEKLPHSIYHIGAGRGYSLREFCDQVRSAVPGAVIDIGPGPGAWNFPPWLFDITRARRDLGYEPQYPPERAVQDWRQWAERFAAARKPE